MEFSELRKGFSILTPPSSDDLLVPLARIKRHCRIPLPVEDHDDLLAGYAKTAEMMIEGHAEIALRPQQRQFWIEALPSCDRRTGFHYLRIETVPVVSIIRIRYWDEDKQEQTLDEAAYRLISDDSPPVIEIDSDFYPTSLDRRLDLWRVEFNCGYTTIPEPAISALLVAAAYWFRNPEDEGRMSDRAPCYRAYTDCIESLRWRLYP